MSLTRTVTFCVDEFRLVPVEQIESLQAELEQLRKAQGEPVAEAMRHAHGGINWLGKLYPDGTKFYTHPAPEQLTRQAALLKQCKEALKHFPSLNTGSVRAENALSAIEEYEKK